VSDQVHVPKKSAEQDAVPAAKRTTDRGGGETVTQLRVQPIAQRQSAFRASVEAAPRATVMPSIPSLQDRRAAFRSSHEPGEKIAEPQVEAPATIQSHEAPAEPAPPPPHRNDTGLPDRLKAGVEAMSGFSMDDVKVHYGSSKPAQLQALAYTQGTDIHVGPGQERHLPHEAWHVVQQKQGRVKATLQMKGVALNHDKELEREADAMGPQALGSQRSRNLVAIPASFQSVVQRVLRVGGKDFQVYDRGRNNKAEVREISSAVEMGLQHLGLQLSKKGHSQISQWCEEAGPIIFNDLAALLKWLVDNKLTYQKINVNMPGPKTLGKRPTFSGRANELKYGKKHGDTARRHIISSSTLGEAIEASEAPIESVRTFLQRHGKAIGGKTPLTAALRAAWELAHNHVGNLWVGPSPINTAIGFVRGPLNEAVRVLRASTAPVEAASIVSIVTKPSGPMSQDALQAHKDFVELVKVVLLEEADTDGFVEPVSTVEFLIDASRNADLDKPDTTSEEYYRDLRVIYLALKSVKSSHVNIFEESGVLDAFMKLEAPPPGPIRSQMAQAVLNASRVYHGVVNWAKESPIQAGVFVAAAAIGVAVLGANLLGYLAN
jgi:hypothetical protein